MAQLRWLALACFVFAITAISFAIAAEESPAPSNTVDFAGKIVWAMIPSATMMEDNRNTEILENATLQKIGDRYFLTGKPHLRPGAAPDWRSGQSAAVALDRVQQYYVYTPEQFKEVMKNYDEEEDSSE